MPMHDTRQGVITSSGSRVPIGSVIAPAIMGQICLHASMTGLRLAAPLYALRQGYDQAAIGLLVALFALTQIFLSLPAGRYADSHGLKRPVTVCVIMASSGIGLAALWPTYLALCVGAMLSGGSVGAATIALQRHVGRAVVSPRELKKAFSLLTLAPAFASFIGPTVAGLLIDRAGFRITFAALAILPLLTWLLIRKACDSGGNKENRNTNIGGAWELMAQSGMRRLILVNTLMVSAWEFHGFMVPVLGHERGIAALIVGMIMGAFAAGVVLVRIALPAIARHVRDRVLIAASLCFSGLLLFTYPFMTSAYTMATCSLLLGMALGCLQPLVLSLLHFMMPNHRQGEALAVRLMFSNVSSLAVPVLVGTASGLLSASAVFWLMGTLVIIGSRSALRLHDIGSPTQSKDTVG